MFFSGSIGDSFEEYCGDGLYSLSPPGMILARQEWREKCQEWHNAMRDKFTPLLHDGRGTYSRKVTEPKGRAASYDY
jgi:hypothetical protein